MNGRRNQLHCDNCPSKDDGIFCELEHLALDDVSDHKVVNSYKKGQTLFVQGNPPYGMYCASTENIKISQIGEDGKESIVRIASAGDVLGHRSIFTDQYYNATTTAVEECTVCFIDKKYILKLVKEQPSVACNLIAKLGHDLRSAEKRISSFYQKMFESVWPNYYCYLKSLMV